MITFLYSSRKNKATKLICGKKIRTRVAGGEEWIGKRHEGTI